MDLQTAAKRYEEARNFWAREIALKLSAGYYRKQIAILRHLVAHASLPTDRLITLQYANQHSRETTSVNLLKNLRKAGLVTRKRHNRTYWYAPTELGELVLEYIPDTQFGSKSENVPDTQFGSKSENVPDTQFGSKSENVPDTQFGSKEKKRGRPRMTPALTAQSG